MKRRLISILLAISMAITLLPGTVWADDATIDKTSLAEKQNVTATDSLETDPTEDLKSEEILNPKSGIERSTPSDFGTYGNIMYQIEDGEITITGLRAGPDNSTVNIPAQIDGIPVTEIRSSAFANKTQLISVSIPGSVKSIGSGGASIGGAFEGCTNLTTVVLSDGLEIIGPHTFNGCSSLTSITIPSSVTDIGMYAFYKCSSLTEVISVNHEGDCTIRPYAFAYCTELTSANIPKGTTAVGSDMFLYCTKLSYVTIPDTVISIKDGAFSHCSNLKNISIPNSVATIESNAFALSGITNVTIPNSVVNVGDALFNKCSNLTSVVIQEGVPTISSCMFEECVKLDNISLPTSIETIKSNAFWKCTSLSNITIPKGVMSIDSAFYECTKLKSIVLPDTVTSLSRSFIGCTELVSVTIPKSVTYIWDAFDGCENLTISCYRSSAAHQYAQKEGIPYELIDGGLNVPFLIGDTTVSMEIQWDPEGMFAGSPSIFNKNVAVAGLVLSAASEQGQNAIDSTMASLGFSDLDHDGYSLNRMSEPANSIGMQKIRIGNQEKTLVVLVIRGTSNVNDVLTDIYAVKDGFSGAEKYVHKRLTDYLSALPELRKDNTILFITGHSLGGVTAGLVGSSCIKEGLTTSGNIFTYTFASPTSAENLNIDPRIHNVINKDDIITKVPRTYHTGLNHNYTTKNNAAFINMYKKLSGVEPNLNPGNPKDSILVRHLPGTYMALLLSGEKISTTSLFGHRVVRILCPVDVEIYDSAGTLVGRVVNNAVDESLTTNDVFIFVENEEKYIYLLEDEAYSFKLTGTDEGTLEYSVQDFAIDETLMVEKTYSNVSLAVDKKMTSSVGGTTDTPDVQLVILGDNGEGTYKVLPDGKGTEVPINTPVVTFNAVDSSNSIVPVPVEYDGTLKSLPIPIRDGYTFNGWFTATSGGTRITTETVFSSDTTIYAQWTKNSTNPGGTVSPGTPTYNPGGTYVPPTYNITPPNVSGGKISVNPTSASSGSIVAITTVPDAGYKLTSLTVSDANGKNLELSSKAENQYTFKMPNGKVTIAAQFQPINGDTPWQNPFTDVSETDWYFNAVRSANENGLMRGVGNGSFAPNVHLSRAMFAQILYNKAGQPSIINSNVFSDVPDGTWFTDAVAWGAANSIVNGYNGQFSPDDPITREQLVLMLWRYEGQPTTSNTLLNFTDAANVSNYALSAMCWAAEKGIIKGKGNGILDPQGFATRAETAQVLKNYLEN